MYIVDVESVKSLKKTRDIETGEEKQPVKGTIEFNVPLEEAGKLNGKKCVIMTKEQYDAISEGETDVIKCREYANQVFKECLKFTEG